MVIDFNHEVKLFMVFDILGDMERTGPKLWKIDRSRLEDIKNHTFDLILMYRILKDKLPIKLDENKMLDYFLCHDLPEAITGDITKFQGVSSSERKRVTDIAISYLASSYGDIIDFGTIINGFETQVDIEAKVAKMFDSIHSATTFMKYQLEQNIDMNNPEIIPVLRNLPIVVEKIAEGKDLADVFYAVHSAALTISDEECVRYGISRETADRILVVIRSFMQTFYNQKLNGALLAASSEFPKEAMIYNPNYNLDGNLKR